MKKGKVKPDQLKTLLQLFSGLNGRHEQHSASCRHDLEELHDHEIAELVLHAVQSCKFDVWSVHAGHHHPSVWHSKRFKNAALALYASGRGECEHRWATKRRADSAQPAIVRSKILPPPVDAVCFVDNQVTRAGADDFLNFGLTHHFGVEPFRRTVQELDRAVPQQLVSDFLFPRA